MRRYLLIAVLSGAPAATLADVRVFVTSSASGYGLDLLGPQGDGTGIDPEHEDWPIDPFRPTYSTVDPATGYTFYGHDYEYAYYRAAAYPPIEAPSGTADNPILIDASAGEWPYIWFQFRNEPALRKVNGLIVQADPAGQPEEPTPALTFTYYLQNNMDEYGVKRWNGAATPPDYPGWHENPQVLMELATRSIQNLGDDPLNMFDNQRIDGSLRTGVALLGAISGSASEIVYEYSIDAVTYANGYAPAVGEHAFFKVVPEPQAVMLLALAALVRRRR
jgi:hypothetical protein